MRPSTNSFAAVPIPRRLSRRPRDSRGYPLGCLVLIKPDGTPDFRATDVSKWVAVVKGRCCSLCGESLGANIAFIGGPLSHENRVFTDPGMHLECALYAMKVCPYLAMPNSRHARKVAPVEGISYKVTEHVTVAKPERFFIAVTKAYHPYQLEDGSLVVRAGPWLSTEWFEPPAEKKAT